MWARDVKIKKTGIGIDVFWNGERNHYKHACTLAQLFFTATEHNNRIAYCLRKIFTAIFRFLIHIGTCRA